MTADANIAELHRAYVNFTGLDIGLNMERETTDRWSEVLVLLGLYTPSVPSTKSAVEQNPS